ncbi:MAG: type II toxin-antitoxin system PemK/MazF family toxin [Gemmatimonadales bacterium]|jgi:mRNA interferase MazF|nr:type II toxin-antitoxin system PemK/MazF family toxin [Gemmatimonadales bacterium]MBT3499863.1 type II toxin-antitoxin system PemK/MazF family toxin [Gemmatimonadales bacterium]MBT5044324.1 type II toxin-antitoxin system PemK/MazF family toxin [Gemmatimonadales bacterium]MBT6695226.1 type II toxin-antitoxin system PemK/MazF family toxin [Gemmatimonadales bacterium]MBT7124585.1 type II toxin-antitoxin system PemK/MazF family toxin [Gemmatimonadales bacterium]
MGVDDRDHRRAVVISQGDVWLLETPNDKRRPVLIVTRDEAINVLNNLVVAPFTTTIRSIPTCVPIGPGHGIDRESVASFDNIAIVPKALLTSHLGSLGPSGHRQICTAIAALADC